MKSRFLFLGGSILLLMLVLWGAELNVVHAMNLPADGTINCPLARVRSGPGTDYSIVATLNGGTQISILNQQNDWYQIKTAQIKGWVASSLIDTKPEIKLEVMEKLANLRSGPGINYDKVGEVFQGDILLLLDTDGDWYRISSSNGTEAYIKSSLVERVDEVMPVLATGTGSSPQVIANLTSNPVAGKIDVKLNNKLLNFEVDPIIVNGRTLVPLRAIFEALGATVDWDAAKQKVSANRASTVVELTIGSLHPTVNGQDWPLEVPAQILKGRTLAPLRFVAEAFGSKVNWDAASQTVSIDASMLTQKPDPDPPSSEETDSSTDPASVIHIKNTKDDTGLRIMLQSNTEMDPDIEEESGQITLIFKNQQTAEINLIEEKLGGKTFKIQASNQDQDTKISINMPAELEYEILSEDGGCRQIIYIPNCITNIKKAAYGSVGERIIVSSLCPLSHSEKQLGDKLEIRLKNIQESPGSAFSCSSNLIKKLQINPCPDNPNDLLISIDTKDLGKFTTATTGDNKDLSIFLFNKQAIKSRSNVVVLDPGHGGSEPGTHGTYLIEKDPNLEVGLKVGEILKQKGIPIEFTRCDDSYMELDVRATLANDLNAALFVSIHHNGVDLPTASGTETYYYAPVDNPELFMQKDERAHLASLIQNELVSLLGRKNRGVKDHRSFAVLCNTQMPSALAELAFLTNPEEEQMVMQNEYKDLAAQAIANGIINYLQNK